MCRPPRDGAVRGVDDATTNETMSQEEITAAAVAQAEINRAQITIEQDRTYDILQKRYVDWVYDKIQDRKFDAAEFVANGRRIFCRAYIDLYFHEVIAEWVVSPESARRAVSALQRLADNTENFSAAERFVVYDSPLVRSGLRISKDKYEAQQRGLNRISDPHANLKTNQLREQDKRRFVRYVLEIDRSNWTALTQCFTGSEAMMLRTHSMKKMTLSDLLYNDTHAPSQGGDGDHDTGMLGMVYQPMQHKERNSSKHIVGAWRHKHLLQCFTSMSAMSFFVTHRSNPDLHFRRDDYSEPAPWWNIPLITGWSATNSAVKAYREVFNALGINPEKCTHVRRSGTEFASAQGELPANVIGTMTKHRAPNQSTLETHYNTELHRAVLECMAGFPRMHGEYFVARTRIDVEAWFPGGIDEMILLLFPQYLDWCEQQEDEDTGDDSKCADNFLHGVIKFFAKVIVQDGCFWIDLFPNHVVSRTLRSVLPPDYVNRAAAARQWCQTQEQQRALNRQGQADFRANLVQQFSQLLQQSQQQSQQHLQVFFQQQLEQQLPQYFLPWNHQLQQMNHSIQLAFHQQHQLLLQIQQHATVGVGQVVGVGGRGIGVGVGRGGGGRGGVGGGGRGGNGNEGRGGNGNEGNGHDGGGHDGFGGGGGGRGRGRGGGGGRAGGRGTLGRGGRALGHGGFGRGGGRQGVHGVLRNVPLVPPIPTAMPESVRHLIAVWHGNDMMRFITADKSQWDSALRNRFSRWKYIYEKVCEKEQAMRNHGERVEDERQRLSRAARALDTIREDLGLSMRQYLTYLKEGDHTLQRRQRLPR
jgi:hypothetical protein